MQMKLATAAALAALLALPAAADPRPSETGHVRYAAPAVPRVVIRLPAHAPRHEGRRGWGGRDDHHRPRHDHDGSRHGDRGRHGGWRPHRPQWTGPGYWSAYRYPYRHRVHPDFAPGWRFAPPPRRWW